MEHSTADASNSQRRRFALPRFRRFARARRIIATGLLTGLACGVFDTAFATKALSTRPAGDNIFVASVGRAIIFESLVGAAIGVVFACFWYALRRGRPDSERLQFFERLSVTTAVLFLFTVGLGLLYGPILIDPAWHCPGLVQHVFVFVIAALIACVIQAVWQIMVRIDKNEFALRASVPVLITMAAIRVAADAGDRGVPAFVHKSAEPVAATATSESRAGKPDIVFVTIDTLRADRTSVYDEERNTTPHLRKFAAEGVVFDNMIAQSPWTRPSFGSMWTGRYPSFHQAAFRIRERDVIPPSYNRGLVPGLPTLPELLSDAGYFTAGVNTNVQINAEFGFGRGFDRFIDISRPVDALASSAMCHAIEFHTALDCDDWSAMTKEHAYIEADRVYGVFEHLFESAKTEDAPVFLWIHFMDPHAPYYDRDGNRAVVTYDDIATLVTETENRDSNLEQLEHAYDREIRYVDRHVGQLIDRLDRDSRFRNALVLVVSDHGEELGERWKPQDSLSKEDSWYFRGYGHGHTMFDDQLKVPLIIRQRGRIAKGRRIDSVVQHVDLLPTLLAAAGLKTESQSLKLDGMNLYDVIRAPSLTADRTAFSEASLYGPELKQVRNQSKKLVIRTHNGRSESYDLLADPSETNREANIGGDMFAALKNRLSDWMAKLPDYERDETDADASHTESKALREKLEALGYLR